MAAARKGPKKMTDEHKAALAIGRNEGRAIRKYLEALEAHRPKRGRKRTSDSIQRRLQVIDDELPVCDPLTRVNLIQERMDLVNELDNMVESVDLSELEEEFIAVAASYSERRGISYAAWRELGVEPGVLRRAGIRRSAS